MNRNVASQFNYDLVNRGVEIRNPSTASFNVDSTDRNLGLYPSATSFAITPSNSLIDGRFTRFGLSEVELNWNFPNVSRYCIGSLFTGTRYRPPVEGVSDEAYDPLLVQLPDGYYTMKSALDTLVIALNTELGSTVFAVVQLNPQTILTTSVNFPIVGTWALGTVDTSTFVIFVPPSVVADTGNPSNRCLASMMGFRPAPASTLVLGSYYQYWSVMDPLLLSVPYIDFISPQISSQSSVKDVSTSPASQIDNVYRWNLAWDTPPLYDSYGFPIYQGYTPFKSRRYLAFPKQIKWDPIIPFGQVSFVVSGPGYPFNSQTSYSNYALQSPYGSLEFQMNFLVTEA